MNDKISQLNEFLLQSPNDSFLKHALALEWLKENNLAAAKKYFEEVIKIDPQYVGTYYHLAKLYIELSEKELAKQTFEQGLAIAKQQKNNHTYNELQNAFEDFLDL